MACQQGGHQHYALMEERPEGAEDQRAKDKGVEIRLWLLALFNLVYCIIQLFASVSFHSLALLSDAFHNLSDVAAIVLAVMIHRLQESDPKSDRLPYGYRRADVVGGFGNSIALVALSAYVILSAIPRLLAPEESHVTVGFVLVALAGVVVNMFGIVFFCGHAGGGGGEDGGLSMAHSHSHGHGHSHSHGHGEKKQRYAPLEMDEEEMEAGSRALDRPSSSQSLTAGPMSVLAPMSLELAAANLQKSFSEDDDVEAADVDDSDSPSPCRSDKDRGGKVLGATGDGNSPEGGGCGGSGGGGGDHHGHSHGSNNHQERHREEDHHHRHAQRQHDDVDNPHQRACGGDSHGHDHSTHGHEHTHEHGHAHEHEHAHGHAGADTHTSHSKEQHTGCHHGGVTAAVAKAAKGKGGSCCNGEKVCCGVPVSVGGSLDSGKTCCNNGGGGSGNYRYHNEHDGCAGDVRVNSTGSHRECGGGADSHSDVVLAGGGGGGAHTQHPYCSSRGGAGGDCGHHGSGAAAAAGGGGGDSHGGVNMNLWAVFVHCLADSVMSGAVAGIGVVIILFGDPDQLDWTDYLDPVASLLLSLFIAAASWPVIKASAHVLLEGTPHGFDLAELTEAIQRVHGVIGVDRLVITQLNSGAPFAGTVKVRASLNECHSHGARNRQEGLKGEDSVTTATCCRSDEANSKTSSTAITRRIERVMLRYHVKWSTVEVVAAHEHVL